jgi:hypothetical protein
VLCALVALRFLLGPEVRDRSFSYSPIHDDSDEVAGLLVVATDTTAQVIDRRRFIGIGDLASALVGATSIESVADVTIAALRDCVPATATAINVVLGDSVVRIASQPEDRAEATDPALIRHLASSPFPLVLDEGWQPGRPASRVAFAVDHPTLRTVVTVATNPGRPFDEEYQQFIDLGRADELGALRLICDTLQNAMLELASDLPTVAARYLPIASNLTVGDGRGPAEVVASLDRFAMTMPAALCATVVCAIVDLGEQTITYSNAGHPPPLLVQGDQVVWLDQALATPLAVDGPTRREARLDVRPGDLLVLYTDGLVERRNETIDVGLGRLARAAVPLRDEPVEEVANGLIDGLVGTTARDDVALVVKRIH